MDRIRAGPVLLGRANHNVRRSTTKKIPEVPLRFTILQRKHRLVEGSRSGPWGCFSSAGPARSVAFVEAAGSSNDGFFGEFARSRDALTHIFDTLSPLLTTEEPVRHKWAAPFLCSFIGVFLGPGFSEAQTMSAAKVCQLLPMADLEAHFGARVTASRGLDRTTSSTCAADIPDRMQGTLVNRQPPSPAPSTPQRRMDRLKSGAKIKDSDIKDFGNVVCFRSEVDLGQAKLPTVTCFMDQGGYLALTLNSQNPKFLTFDAAKSLLEKAAALRK
jgi:hypothetical protein